MTAKTAGAKAPAKTAKPATTATAAAPSVKTPTAAAAAKAGDTLVLVHAYRRKPHMVLAKDGVGHVEGDVEVDVPGVGKAKFRSNDDGHIIGECPSALAAHLTSKIPEAYIVYDGGENVPVGLIPGTLAAKEAQAKPEGKFVLSNGEDFVVLDGMDDAEVREFALDVAKLEPDAVPDVLKGDSLKQAVFNLLQATSSNA